MSDYAGTLKFNTEIDGDGFNDGLSSIGSMSTETLSKTGKNLTKVSASIVGIGTACVGTTASFESQMSKVQSISGASGDDLDKLSEKAKEMGAKTKFSATESGEAFEYMAMAGWKTNDMLDGIEGVMNLAAASGEDLATTSDIVTDALTAFGLGASDASHFSDVLAQASSNSNTTVSGMGESFKYVGSMAGSLGYSIEDVSLALGTMANAGVKGTMSGTALNGFLTRLSSNTGRARDALDELGISFFDSEGNARDLSDVLDDLRNSTANMNDEQKTQLANTLAGTEGQKGLLAILNASEKDWTKLGDAVGSADGASQEMAETMQNNLSGSITTLKSATEGLMIKLGEMGSGPIKTVVDRITDFVSWLSTASDGTVSFVIAISGIVAGIGPAMLITAKMIDTVQKLKKGYETVSSAVTKFKDVVSASTGKMNLMSKATLTDTGRTVKNTSAKKLNALANTRVGNSAKGAVAKISMMSKASLLALGGVGLLVGGLVALGLYMAKTGKSGEDIANDITAFADKLADGITSFADKIPDIVDGLTDALITIINSLVEVLPTVIEPIMTALVAILPTLIAAGIKLFMGLIDAFTEILPVLTDALPDIITAIVNAIPVLLPAIIDAGITIFLALLDAIPQIIPPLVKAVPKIISAIFSALVKGQARVMKAGVKLLGSLKKGLGSLFKVGKDWIAGLWNGIKNKKTWLVNKIKNLCSNALQAVKDFFGIQSPSKVMEKEVGVYLTEGIGKGITSRTTSLVKTAKTQCEELKNAYGLGIGVDSSLTTSAVSGASALGASASNQLRDKMADGASGSISNSNSSVVNQTVNFNVKNTSPIETARMLKRNALMGLAGA